MQKGRVFVVFGNKGGTGKSMTAAHLAVYLKGQGRAVAVLDLDARQGDSMGFFEKRKDGTPVCAPVDTAELDKMLGSMSAAGADVVVDCPPADSPLSLRACDYANALVMPFRAGANDARALGRAIRIASQSQTVNGTPRLLSVVNFLQPSTRDSKALMALLQSSDLFQFMGSIGQRTAFNDAIRQGKAVWETAPGSVAAQEAWDVCGSIHAAIKL